MHAFLCVLALEKKKIQSCLLILQTWEVYISFTTSYFTSAMKCFKQFISFWHLPLQSKNVTIHHRKNSFLNWALQGITQAKCCTASFSVYLDFCSKVEMLQRNALTNTSFVQFSVSSKSHGHFLVWIQTHAYIWFVPDCGKWLRKKQDLFSGSSYSNSLTVKNKLFLPAAWLMWMFC